LKYSVNMLLTCTLYYDALPSYLISAIRTVCKYRKCSILTGLITSLTDLLQAYHQGQIGRSKTKSTGSPVPAPIALLSEIFFRPPQEPVRRLPKSRKKLSAIHCNKNLYSTHSSQVSPIGHETHANKFNLTLSRLNYYFSRI